MERFRVAALACALAASLIALLGLVGWARGDLALASFGVGLAPMAPATAATPTTRRARGQGTTRPSAFPVAVRTTAAPIHAGGTTGSQ